MRKLKNILILAGGDSTRFWPTGDKNSISFLGCQLLEYQLDLYARLAEKITVVTSEANKEMVNRLAFGMEKKHKLPVVPVIQSPRLPGQAGAVVSASNINGEVLIVNANDIFNLNVIGKLVNHADENKDQYVFLARKVTEYFPGGYVYYNKGKVRGIIEKPVPGKEPSDTVKLVVDYFSDFQIIVKALDEINIINDDGYEQGLNKLISGGIKTDDIIYNDWWITLKYSWQILTMMKHFLQSITANIIDPSSSISDKSLIIPPVVISKNVRIGDFAKIVGPVFIGDNTIVGDYAMVRDSMIGENCTIGGYSEVARSYLGDRVMLHQNYVGDSVLDDEVLMGAGAVTANFRFDQSRVKSLVNGRKIDTGQSKLGMIAGKKAKIGVNCTVLPGIKIGKGSFAAPGSIIDKDIGDGLFFTKGLVRENKHEIFEI